MTRAFFPKTAALLLSLCASVACGGGKKSGDDSHSESEKGQNKKKESSEGKKALRNFRLATELEVELIAEEPQLVNPVSFDVANNGDIYVVETHRLGRGVFDVREKTSWLEEDLASRTVEDRIKLVKTRLPEDLEELSKYSEKVKRLRDTNGDRKIDESIVFAEGFNAVEDGVAAGVLVDGDKVWFTCIPKIYRFHDQDDDGKPEGRDILFDGFGVHFGFLGHDLHGLKIGPDRRLYFSVGDRGLNVLTDRGRLAYPDTGAVLRMELDGTDLEVFHTGLRNPQELAFDAFGNLFTADNNSDSGDKARWVYVGEEGDSGWRIGYQFLETRGPWNLEKLWHLEHKGQPAWILPPVAHASSGPSGIAFNPGTGLPDHYANHFFMADFRGAASHSRILAYAFQPKGAGFELIPREERALVSNVVATDIAFGADGGFYILDWVHGWQMPDKGRIYRVFSSNPAVIANIKRVQDLLRKPFTKMTDQQLLDLLDFEDQRVRIKAQFAYVDRVLAVEHEERKKLLEGLFAIAKDPESERLHRLHAVWALGIVGRKHKDVLRPAIELLNSGESYVRAHVAKILGEGHVRGAEDSLVSALRDTDSKVRYQAAIALGKVELTLEARKRATSEILDALRRNEDHDVYIRHSLALALSKVGDRAQILEAIKDPSEAVRVGVLLALRKMSSVEVAEFLNDPSDRLVTEAARAIYDVPIKESIPSLASLLDTERVQKGELAKDEALLRRVISANRRLGTEDAANRLLRFIGEATMLESMRIEALDVLAEWEKPSWQDRVLGLNRPVQVKKKKEAAEQAAQVEGKVEDSSEANSKESTSEKQRAFEPWRVNFIKLASGVISDPSESVRRRLIEVSSQLGAGELSSAIEKVAANQEEVVAVRLAAFLALEKFESPQLAELSRGIGAGSPAELKKFAIRILAKADPDHVVDVLESLIASAPSQAEQQAAVQVLGELSGEKAAKVIVRHLEQLRKGTLAESLHLELLEAAAIRQEKEVREALAALESERKATGDPLAGYRETLAGGNADTGGKIFREHVSAQCVRCHAIGEVGGDVGPALDDIGDRKDRQYLLESLVIPGAQVEERYKGIDGNSAMPSMGTLLSRRELRDLIEFLANQRNTG